MRRSVERALGEPSRWIGGDPNRWIGGEPSRWIGVLVVLVAVVGCTPPSAPPDGIEVKDISVGRSLAADDTIEARARTNSFWATDTFLVSVTLEGTADDLTLQARWTGPDAKVVAEASESVTVRGATVTAFEAPPPDGRWPLGAYEVEILIGGKSQGSMELHAR